MAGETAAPKAVHQAAPAPADSAERGGGSSRTVTAQQPQSASGDSAGAGMTNAPRHLRTCSASDDSGASSATISSGSDGEGPTSPAVTQLQAALTEHLQLHDMQQQAQAATGCRPQAAAALRQSVLHVQSAFGDLLKLSPQTLFLSASGDRVQEAQMWDCFAEVYEAELAQRGRAALPEDTRRQVLADILVWAEITQSHYDPNTASFVTRPHDSDASFQRIGKLLKAAKQQRGLA